MIVFSGAESLSKFLPEPLWVFRGSRPAQVRLLLQQLPGDVVWRQLRRGNVLQEDEDEDVLLLVEETKTGRKKQDGGEAAG